FAGSGANTYTGTTTVSVGVLQLNKTAGMNAIPGSLIVNGTTQLLAASQIADSAAVVVNGAGVLNLNSFNETIATLSGSGGVTLGSGTLTTGDATNTTFSGVITSVIGSTGGITKQGT